MVIDHMISSKQKCSDDVIYQVKAYGICYDESYMGDLQSYLAYLIILYSLMSRIIPLTPSFQLCSTFSSSKEDPEDDCRSVASSCYSSNSKVSAFQSLASSHRINQIKPKLKISVSRRSTLASTNPKLQNQDQSSPSRISIDLTPKRTIKLRPPQSIEYSTIKPLFNWNRVAFLCGATNDALGEHGCLCGPTCPWKQEWVRDRERLDFRIFQNLLKVEASSENLVQIEKDLPRTHPQCPTFTKNVEFRQMLRKVLVAYSVYDLEMGYVQGVNMVAGVLLYHIKNQSLAFWALVGLMEEQELRQVYLAGFQQLRVHCSNICSAIQQYVNDLYCHMEELQVVPDCFLNGWLLSLMSTAIPMEYMHQVVDRFRKHGWSYLYQLVVTYLLYLKEFLMASRDEAEFLMFLSTKSSRQLGVEWKYMIQSASKLKI